MFSLNACDTDQYVELEIIDAKTKKVIKRVTTKVRQSDFGLNLTPNILFPLLGALDFKEGPNGSKKNSGVPNLPISILGGLNVKGKNNVLQEILSNVLPSFDANFGSTSKTIVEETEDYIIKVVNESSGFNIKLKLPLL